MKGSEDINEVLSLASMTDGIAHAPYPAQHVRATDEGRDIEDDEGNEGENETKDDEYENESKDHDGELDDEGPEVDHLRNLGPEVRGGNPSRAPGPEG